MMMMLTVMLIGAVSAASDSKLLDGWSKSKGGYQRIRKDMLKIYQKEKPVFTATSFKPRTHGETWESGSVVWDNKGHCFATVNEDQKGKGPGAKSVLITDGANIEKSARKDQLILLESKPINTELFYTHHDVLEFNRGYTPYMQFVANKGNEAAWFTFQKTGETNPEEMRFVEVKINVAGKEQQNECEAYKSYLIEDIKKIHAERRQVSEKKKVQSGTKMQASFKANMDKIRELEKSGSKKDTGNDVPDFMKEIREKKASRKKPASKKRPSNTGPKSAAEWHRVLVGANTRVADCDLKKQLEGEDVEAIKAWIKRKKPKMKAMMLRNIINATDVGRFRKYLALYAQDLA